MFRTEETHRSLRDCILSMGCLEFSTSLLYYQSKYTICVKNCFCIYMLTSLGMFQPMHIIFEQRIRLITIDLFYIRWTLYYLLVV